jgi:hypothetical protein
MLALVVGIAIPVGLGFWAGSICTCTIRRAQSTVCRCVRFLPPRGTLSHESIHLGSHRRAEPSIRCLWMARRDLHGTNFARLSRPSRYG